MTCRQLHPYIVDLARGALERSAVEARVERHVRECSSCAALLDRERTLSVSLRRLTQGADVPAVDADRERALLAAFDQANAQISSRPPARVWAYSAAITATLVLAAIVGGNLRDHQSAERAARGGPETRGERAIPSGAGTVRHEEEGPPAVGGGDGPPIQKTSGPVRRQSTARMDRIADAQIDRGAFVTWPGADAWPAFESGELMRVDLPVSSLPALGLWLPSSAVAAVPADVLIGQDGFARAVRLVFE